MRNVLLLTCLLVGCLGCALLSRKVPQEEPTVRVLLFSDVKEFVLTTSGQFQCSAPQGQSSIFSKDQQVVFRATEQGIEWSTRQQQLGMAPVFVTLAGESPHTECVISRLVSEGQGEVEWVEGRRYQGILEIRRQSNGNLSGICQLPIEEYLCGVVPSEIGADAPFEAQKVQAIAARTETLSSLADRRYAGDHYDICSTVMCQVFTGRTRSTPETDMAVFETRGIAMLHRGKPIGAFYASNCGGHSEHSENAWKGRGVLPYCRGISDSRKRIRLDLTREDDFAKWIGSMPDCYCNPNSPGIPDWAKRRFRWERRVSAEEVQGCVKRIQDIGRVQTIKPLSRGISGRIIELEFRGENGTCIVGPELTIRRLFDPMLYSAAFVIEPEGQGAFPESFLIRGAGSGHGVGLCQVGAMGMAGRGIRCDKILKHYFTGIKLKKMY